MTTDISEEGLESPIDWHLTGTDGRTVAHRGVARRLVLPS
jgi:hypothetical protein